MLYRSPKVDFNKLCTLPIRNMSTRTLFETTSIIKTIFLGQKQLESEHFFRKLPYKRKPHINETSDQLQKNFLKKMVINLRLMDVAPILLLVQLFGMISLLILDLKMI